MCVCVSALIFATIFAPCFYFQVLNERPNPNEFTGAELILLVLCNNPNEAKNTANFRRYLKKVENEVVPKITTLPLGQVS